MHPVNIHTGGSCRGNPGPGRSAASIQSQSGDHFLTLSGGKPRRHQRPHGAHGGHQGHGGRQLRPRLEGSPGHRPFRPQYAVDAFNEKRVSGWTKCGRRNSKDQPVPNRDLRKELPALTGNLNVQRVRAKEQSENSPNLTCWTGRRLQARFARGQAQAWGPRSSTCNPARKPRPGMGRRTHHLRDGREIPPGTGPAVPHPRPGPKRRQQPGSAPVHQANPCRNAGTTPRRTMSSQARQRRGPLPCGQEGCYYPESAGDLRWCVYAGYWRYHCPRPEQPRIPPRSQRTPPKDSRRTRPKDNRRTLPRNNRRIPPKDRRRTPARWLRTRPQSSSNCCPRLPQVRPPNGAPAEGVDSSTPGHQPPALGRWLAVSR